MELLPDLRISWLNGWLVIILLATTDVIMFLSFPKPVVARLFDRSGWSEQQRVFTIAGKLCGLVCLVLITLTSLKIGKPVFVVGLLLVLLGLIGLVRALIDFKNTPMDKPVTRGLYKISRHPQIVMATVVLLGACIAISSWLALILLVASRLLEYFGIVAEEEVCVTQYGEAYRAYLKQVPRYFVFF